MKKAEEAVKVFADGYNCAQAVLSVFAPETGLTREQAMKVSCGFGGGMGRQGEMCGAVTGAIMALSVHRASAELDEAAKARAYAAVRQFFEEFRKQNGSVECRELLGCNIGTEEGMRQARESGVFKMRCPGFVENAVKIVQELLVENADRLKQN